MYVTAFSPQDILLSFCLFIFGSVALKPPPPPPTHTHTLNFIIGSQADTFCRNGAGSLWRLRSHTFSGEKTEEPRSPSACLKASYVTPIHQGSLNRNNNKWPSLMTFWSSVWSWEFFTLVADESLMSLRCKYCWRMTSSIELLFMSPRQSNGQWILVICYEWPVQTVDGQSHG